MLGNTGATNKKVTGSELVANTTQLTRYAAEERLTTDNGSVGRLAPPDAVVEGRRGRTANQNNGSEP
jgi:hypothetical protein